jgi:hypothetical protein
MNKNLFDISSAASIGAAAEKLTKFSSFKGSKQKPSKKGKTPVKKVAEPKAVVANPPAVKRDPRTMGKEATHKRSADTGKVSKLTPKQKSDVDKYNSPRQFIKATPPSVVDLRDIT